MPHSHCRNTIQLVMPRKNNSWSLCTESHKQGQCRLWSNKYWTNNCNWERSRMFSFRRMSSHKLGLYKYFLCRLQPHNYNLEYSHRFSFHCMSSHKQDLYKYFLCRLLPHNYNLARNCKS